MFPATSCGLDLPATRNPFQAMKVFPSERPEASDLAKARDDGERRWLRYRWNWLEWRTKPWARVIGGGSAKGERIGRKRTGSRCDRAPLFGCNQSLEWASRCLYRGSIVRIMCIMSFSNL
jgi:hypothetical protein